MNKSDLEKQSFDILCNHINSLNNKFHEDNLSFFSKQFIKNSTNNNNHISLNPEKINYLNSMTISKKDCIYTPTEIDFKEWEQIFYETKAKPFFNISTQPKMNSLNFYNCP